MEVLDHESERVLDPDRGADATGSASGNTGDSTPAFAVEHGRRFDVVRGADPQCEARTGRNGAGAQDQRMVHELLVSPQIQGTWLLGAQDEPEPVDPEMAAGGEIGDDQLGVRAANDVGRGADVARCLRTDHRGQRIDSVDVHGSTHR